jgi:hypothetical protein
MFCGCVQILQILQTCLVLTFRTAKIRDFLQTLDGVRQQLSGKITENSGAYLGFSEKYGSSKISLKASRDCSWMPLPMVGSVGSPGISMV